MLLTSFIQQAQRIALHWPQWRWVTLSGYEDGFLEANWSFSLRDKDELHITSSESDMPPEICTTHHEHEIDQATRPIAYQAECIDVLAHVMFHSSYCTPALYFSLRHGDGTPVEDVMQLIQSSFHSTPSNSDPARWSFITKTVCNGEVTSRSDAFHSGRNTLFSAFHFSTFTHVVRLSSWSCLRECLLVRQPLQLHRCRCSRGCL